VSRIHGKSANGIAREKLLLKRVDGRVDIERFDLFLMPTMNDSEQSTATANSNVNDEIR
jgi:hypothetical protein